MATDSDPKSLFKTLTGGAEDVMTLTNPWDFVEIGNRHATASLFYSLTDTVSAEGQDSTSIVPPNSSRTVRTKANADRTVVVHIFSATACPYWVEGVNHQ